MRTLGRNIQNMMTNAGSLTWEILLICSCVVAFLNTEIVNSKTIQPNIIFFSTDDLNTWVNPLGYGQAITPNLDRLSAMGITFTNAHAPAPYCAPSRSAIFSGLHASSTGCYNDEIYFYDRPELASLQSAFSQGGYTTYGAGKTYHHRAGSIDMRGWDTYFSRSQEIKDSGFEMGYYGSDVPYPDTYPYSPYYTQTDREISGAGFLEWGPIPAEKAELIPDVIRTNWVCDLLQQQHNDPFFISLGLYTPHFPNYAPQEFFDLYDRDQIVVPALNANDLNDLPTFIRTKMTNRSSIQQELENLDAVKDAILGYLAAVSFADAMLGRVLDALEASAYKDNTVLIFWSDQGYHHGEKGQWGKHTLWQETSHVPLIIAGNGLPANTQVDTTVSLIDLYPTLIALCQLPSQHNMDGVSLVPTLENPAAAQDRNVLMPYIERGGYAVINSNYRYIQYQDGSEELYDLGNDPNEWTNLAGNQNYQTVIAEMQQSAPDEFAPSATPRNELKLMWEGDVYHWESKDGSKIAPTINASVTFLNPISEKGIDFVVATNQSADSYTEQQIKGDQECRFIPGSKYGFFKVDDALFDSSHSDIYVEITYFDEANGSFELQYNAISSQTKAVSIAKTDTNQWLTKTVMLADAAFNNLQNNQADFRITGEVYIRSVALSRPTEADVSVVFDSQIVEKGINFVVGTNPDRETYTQQATIGGQVCRHIAKTEKNKYGYFRVDDTLIDASDTTLSFEITYFDEGTSPVRIQYNSLDVNYQTSEITRTDTNTWLTKSFTVKDAALRNLQNNQADFRIVSDVYIRRVAIKKEDELSVPSALVEDMGVKLSLKKGVLRVKLSQEISNAGIRVFNLNGQLVYHNELQGTEAVFYTPATSKLYIVEIWSSNKIIRKKVIGL